MELLLALELVRDTVLVVLAPLEKAPLLGGGASMPLGGASRPPEDFAAGAAVGVKDAPDVASSSSTGFFRF